MIDRVGRPVVAVLDACVLIPMPICHTILNLAEEPDTFVAKWSVQILNELARGMVRLGRTEEQATRRLQAMRAAFPEAIVGGYESLIGSMTNDLKDRHVLAAAVRAGAGVIVTQNLRHFPTAALEPFEITACGPDEFLSARFEASPAAAISAVHRQALDVKQDTGWILNKLAPHVPQFAEFVRLASERRFSQSST